MTRTLAGITPKEIARLREMNGYEDGLDGWICTRLINEVERLRASAPTCAWEVVDDDGAHKMVPLTDAGARLVSSLIARAEIAERDLERTQAGLRIANAARDEAYAVAHKAIDERNDARSLTRDAANALEKVIAAWLYEANMGDGIMEENAPVLHAARAALKKARGA